VSYLGSDVASDVGKALADTGAVRWTPAALLPYINATLALLWAHRPDAFYVTAVVIEQPAALAAIGDAVPTLDRWREPIAHRVAALALLEDSTDSANRDLAKTHLPLFEAALVGAL
jgi:hypothetical protein